jgi:hypothetical protein
MARQDGREDELVVDGRHRSPLRAIRPGSRGGVRHSGKAPPLRETMVSRLTQGADFGEDQVARLVLPRPRCRTCGPPLTKAGCFVFGLRSSETQPIPCRQPRIRLRTLTTVKLSCRTCTCSPLAKRPSHVARQAADTTSDRVSHPYLSQLQAFTSMAAQSSKGYVHMPASGYAVVTAFRHGHMAVSGQVYRQTWRRVCVSEYKLTGKTTCQHADH